MSLMDNLLNLHRVEAQVRGLRSRLTAAERYLQGQQAKLDALQEEKQELETRRRQIQARIHNAESEAGGMGVRIEKLRTELNTSATQKQYTALLTEINTVKAARSEIETAILRDMEQAEAMSAELASVEERITERSKHRDIAATQLEERKSEVGDRLSELEVERSAAAAQIPVEHLRIFEELADQYEGEAMAPLETVDRRNREYACGACNMHVPFEAVSALLSSGEAMVRCTVCRRILYMQEETRGALARK